MDFQGKKKLQIHQLITILSSYTEWRWGIIYTVLKEIKGQWKDGCTNKKLQYNVMTEECTTQRKVLQSWDRSAREGSQIELSLER